MSETPRSYVIVFNECCATLREDGCKILGIEITDTALPVHEHPFTGSTAFMLGNEGQGLSSKQKEFCDGFVYIPQYGNGTASLNVAVACSIVLHHFALWANFVEHERQGEKYVVGERPTRAHARGVVPPTEAERRAMQQRRRHPGDTDETAATEAAQQLSDLLNA